MEVFLVRHGVAIPRDGDIPDAFRPLTDKGRRRFRKTARSFGRLGCEVDLILTSPLVRAVQTAEILAGEVPHGEVDVLEQLDPRFEAGALLQAVRKRANGLRSVALVGHEPQISSVLAALAGADAETLDVKKGGIVRLDVRDASQRGSATAIWSLKPKSKAVKKGLPVAKTEAEETTAEERTAKKKMKRSTSRRSAKRKSAPGIAAVDPQPASDAVLGADAEDATKGPADTASSERTADAPAAANDEARSGSESPVPPT